MFESVGGENRWDSSRALAVVLTVLVSAFAAVIAY